MFCLISPATVAFTAYGTQVQEDMPSSGYVVQFPGVLSNSGGYDAGSGVFTCPSTGIYYVWTNIYFYNWLVEQVDGYFDIMKDGALVVG